MWEVQPKGPPYRILRSGIPLEIEIRPAPPTSIVIFAILFTLLWVAGSVVVLLSGHHLLLTQSHGGHRVFVGEVQIFPRVPCVSVWKLSASCLGITLRQRWKSQSISLADRNRAGSVQRVCVSSSPKEHPGAL